MLGAKLLMSKAFHPQTDGTSERAIWNVVQILQAMVQPNQKDWATKGFTPFELNYGYMPVLMQCINEGKSLTTSGVRTFVQNAIHNLEMAHDAIIES
jgi:hypothetical protein